MNGNENGKRRAIVLITEQDIEQLLDLPAGYEVSYIGGDLLRSAVVVVVNSDDLAPVLPGCEPPMLHGAFSREQAVVDGEVFARWSWTPTTEASR